MELILASRSPRRQELLRKYGLSFTVREADIDETPPSGASPAEAAKDIALRKAKAVQAACGADVFVVGADTSVLLDGELLGKPGTPENAKRMLRALSGRANTVLTGVAVLHGDTVLTACAVTDVVFYPLTDAQIDAYVASGEPMDKAGAYGVQGLASLFVERIEGDYYNVVGLPVAMLARMLEEAGYPMIGNALAGGRAG